jgi:tRNA1Val (adenine37-N6)-methyltransferase
MSNSYFQFKEFAIQQDRCAMKVSTDACIQGAWTPLRSDITSVLDIGTGTALLSLMIAQRLPKAWIDAIELNEAAAEQAEENVASSRFGDRIRIIKDNAATWKGTRQYDLIICNPPFFKSGLLGPDIDRNAARHIDSLDAGTLTQIVLDHLACQGVASFLWPAKEFEAFKAAASDAGLYLVRQLNVRHRPGGAVTRIVGLWQKTPGSFTQEELIIKKSSEDYSDEFVDLLRPFYLSL